MNSEKSNQNGQDDFYAQRELKKGAAGWVLLTFLGVAYVISGDFAGWNFGIEKAGWGADFLSLQFSWL